MKRLILTLFFVAVIMAVAIFSYILDEKELLHEPFTLGGDEQKYCFLLERGMSLSRFATQLEDAELLRNKKSFVYWARYKKLATKVKAGEYCVEAGDSPVTLLEKMVQGKTVQHSITLIEGWNYRDVLAAVKKNKILTRTLPERLTAENLAKEVGISEAHAEGWFAADTFFFNRGMTDKQLLRRAYNMQKQRLDNAWNNRAKDLPYQSAYEALIMASIIEKETGAAHERPEIAGVFVRRLKIPMRLQTDPTIIYGLGDSYKGNITRKHLNSYTPYNTYQIDGLPPTPIAMPSLAAIEAAVNPKAGKSLYFVAKGDGTHYFSSSLSEHQNAVRKYQLQRKSNYRSSPAN